MRAAAGNGVPALPSIPAATDLFYEKTKNQLTRRSFPAINAGVMMILNLRLLLGALLSGRAAVEV